MFGRYSEQRNATLADHGGIYLIAEDGIRHNQRNREGWQEHAESYYQRSTNQPHDSGFGEHSLTTDVTIEAIERQYNATPAK